MIHRLVVLCFGLLHCQPSVASECNPAELVAEEYQTYLEDVVHSRDAQVGKSREKIHQMLRESGWDGRAESLQFGDEGSLQFEVADDLQTSYEEALLEFKIRVSERLIDVRRLQQIDFVSVSLSAIETMAKGHDSEIRANSPEANALELLRQALEQVGMDDVPYLPEFDRTECDLSLAIRKVAYKKQQELEIDTDYRKRTNAFSDFLEIYNAEKKNSALSPALEAEYEQLSASTENDLRQVRYVFYMWILATLNDTSMIIRDSNSIDSATYDADQSKIGLNLDSWRENGKISEGQWRVMRFWILFNRRYDPNEYSYGEFSGWNTGK